MKLKFRFCWRTSQNQLRWFRLSSTFLFISLIVAPNFVSSLRIRIGNTHSGEYGVGSPSPIQIPLTLTQINSQNRNSQSQNSNSNPSQFQGQGPVVVQNYENPNPNFYHTRVIRPVLTLDDSVVEERGRIRTRVIPLAPSPTATPSPSAPSDLLLQYYRRSQANSNTNSNSNSNPSLKTVILTPLGDDETETDNDNVKDRDRNREISKVEDDENDEDDEQSFEYQDQDQDQESTTVRATATHIPHQIPAALRRNFGHSLKSSSSDIEITTTKRSKDTKDVEPTAKPSRKKNKNKNSLSSSSGGSSNSNSDSNSSTRRRKVKRPSKNKDKLKSTTLKAPTIAEMGDENNPMDEKDGSGNSTSGSSSGGDKNLALEIGSDDGKYALIDSFFNQTVVEQPGILSYRPSVDFQKDNEKTLGNLNENEIWLSEGHLLVLKGGDFDVTNKEVWPAIDNYQRKKRPPPLRIPLDTDNPPPFPVFLNDSGPPVFLAEPPPYLPYPPPGFSMDGNETFDPSRHPPPGLIPLNPNGTLPRLPFPPGGPPPGFGPLSGPPTGIFRPGQPIGGVNNNGGFGVNQGPAAGFGFGGKNKNRLPPPLFPGPIPGPFPPGGNGQSRPGNGNGPQNFPPPPPGYNQNFNGSGPPPGFPFLPPLVLNPADNETDDPSIFLPPPYDFDYELDNSTLVAPGPFAPGLVVPPPKDFYSVYNRTGKPPTSAQTPTTTTSLFFFPGPTAPSTGPGGVTKKQRPNGKKPKFPITNPPDDSLEENYLPPPSSPISTLIETTPIPKDETIYTTTGKNGKKRKQRPKKPFFPDDIPVIEIGSIPESPIPPSSRPSATPNYAISIGTGKFYGDSGISSSNEESDEKTTPPNVTFRPSNVQFPKYSKNPSTSTTPAYISQVIPIYKSIISSTTPKTKTKTTEKLTATTTTTPTTVKPLNNFVYVRGQLKTLEELAAEQAAEDDFESERGPQGPSTPRPPFDSRGYPTRVLDDDNNPIIFDFPKKAERNKPTEVPLKTYYQGTPKYEPTYIPYTSQGKLQNSNGNVNANPIRVNNYNPYGNQPQQQQQPILLQSPPTPTRSRVPQPPTILYPSSIYNNPNNNNNNAGTGRVRGSGNRNYNNNNNNNNQNQGVFINPSSANGQILNNIGPTYFTQTRPQQQQPESPQIQYNNNGQNVNNNGFRPAFPPPTQINPTRGTNRARVLFPGQVAHQQIAFSPFNNNNNGGNNNNNNQNVRIPQYINQNPNSNQFNGGKKRPETSGLPTFAPNGYYNPITNYQVNLNQQGQIQSNNGNNGGGGGFSSPFIPSNQYFPVQQSQPKISNGGNNYNFPAPVSVANFQSDPSVPVNNYGQQPIQIYQNQQQQPQFQPFNNNNNNNRNRNNNNQRLNQFIQPLYDDLSVNFREPIPQYNTESESVTTRTVLKAGPSASPTDKTASPSGTFYSFTRNGPGGFSYKIQL